MEDLERILGGSERGVELTAPWLTGIVALEAVREGGGLQADG